MADLVKAFPRTWRAYLVNAIHDAAGIRGGAMSLFHSILFSDEWLVPLSGLSWEKISHGVPEGCRIGAPCFNFLPDSLVSMLLEENCGVAFRAEMPATWKSCSWKSCGTPDPERTQHLSLNTVSCILPLPPRQSGWQMWPPTDRQYSIFLSQCHQAAWSGLVFHGIC